MTDKPVSTRRPAAPQSSSLSSLFARLLNAGKMQRENIQPRKGKHTRGRVLRRARRYLFLSDKPAKKHDRKQLVVTTAARYEAAKRRTAAAKFGRGCAR